MLKVKECPNCGIEKNVKKEFGIRKSDGVLMPQSWCIECRNSAPPPPKTTVPVPKVTWKESGMKLALTKPRMTVRNKKEQIAVQIPAKFNDLRRMYKSVFPGGKGSPTAELMRMRLEQHYSERRGAIANV